MVHTIIISNQTLRKIYLRRSHARLLLLHVTISIGLICIWRGLLLVAAVVIVHPKMKTPLTISWYGSSPWKIAQNYTRNFLIAICHFRSMTWDNFCNVGSSNAAHWAKIWKKYNWEAALQINVYFSLMNEFLIIKI